MSNVMEATEQRRDTTTLAHRKVWSVVVATAGAIAALGLFLALGFAFTGLYDVGASTRHWPITEWYLNLVRTSSIRAHAAKIEAPPAYNGEANIRRAVGHYTEHCAICHGAPGVERNEVAAGMYPQPPDLTEVSRRYSPSEVFWIIRNGIKMSAMPSMADDGDDMLWATVGLLEKLSGMSAEAFNDLWMASQAQGGHGHMMNMGNPAPDMAAPAGASPSNQAPPSSRSPQEGGHRH